MDGIDAIQRVRANTDVSERTRLLGGQCIFASADKLLQTGKGLGFLDGRSKMVNAGRDVLKIAAQSFR
jgi:hypothetical protein